VILRMEKLLEESFHEDTIFNSSISNFEGYLINYFGEKEFREHLDCENCSKKASAIASK